MEEGVDEKSKKLAELAPVVGAVAGQVDRRAGRGYEDLAESLGADVAAAIAANKKRFEEAVTDVQGGHRGQAGLTALAISPSTDNYARDPEYAPELLDLQTLGPEGDQPGQPGPRLPVLGEASAARTPTSTSRT